MPRARAFGAAIGGRASDAGGAIQERIAWPVSDFLRGLFDVVRWPFERIVWTFERAVVWPLGERTASWPVPGRAVVLSGVALFAVGALSIAAIRGGDGSGETPAVVVAPVKAPAESKPEPEPEPVLQGAVPDFVPEGGDTATTKVAGADTVISSDADAATSAPSDSPAGATLSSAAGKVEDPGPAAIDVARRFSDAFVLYETGRGDAKVRAALDATASPRLTQALLRRPPRLPANVKVPKAKVLNVVPGPRSGDTFTLSASLLRVGVTSELRIDVQRDKGSGQWQVTDVLG
ncbi:MAG TPA: hypothetical protein VF093_08650 [Solirubrobacterales bacterium]